MNAPRRELYVLALPDDAVKPLGHYAIKELVPEIEDAEVERLIGDVARTGGFVDATGKPVDCCQFALLAALWVDDPQKIELKERRRFWTKCKWLAYRAKTGF